MTTILTFPEIILVHCCKFSAIRKKNSKWQVKRKAVNFVTRLEKQIFIVCCSHNSLIRALRCLVITSNVWLSCNQFRKLREKCICWEALRASSFALEVYSFFSWSLFLYIFSTDSSNLAAGLQLKITLSDVIRSTIK